MPLLLLGLCILATFDCVQDENYTTGQKTGYLLLIWLIPLVGVFVYYHFSLRKQKAHLGNRFKTLRERKHSK
ncbi:MAG: PLDc N-terminal domain-containing protein [Verrucomicrobiae bacterium]|nr:PLDc N-terminal domain-containing protein [Verrucomicrobiae bacterium]